MRLAIFLILVLALANFAMAQGQHLKDDSREGKKKAFVIGNASYGIDPLFNPVNDALDMMAALKRLRFEVKIDTNVNYTQLQNDIESWTNDLSDCNIALFYFAGHGRQVAEENYLFPLDGNDNSVYMAKKTACKASEILERMRIGNSNLNIIILDACRAEIPRGRRNSKFKPGLAAMNPIGNAMMICFPAESGKGTSDGPGSRNGVYTAALLKYIEDANIPVSEIFQKVHDEVVSSTKSGQNPCVYSSVGKKYDLCLSYRNEHGGNASDSMSNAELKKVREMPVDPDDQTRHFYRDAVFKINQDIMGVVNSTKDSITGEIEPYGYGSNPDFEHFKYSWNYGLRAIYSHTKFIMPTFAYSLRGNTFLFTITSNNKIISETNGIDLLLQFEVDNRLDHEVKREYSVFAIDYDDIRRTVKSYFAFRAKVLK